MDISLSYDNHVQCKGIIATIADEIKLDEVDEIGKSCILSAMIDRDTDASNEECEMIYV